MHEKTIVSAEDHTILRHGLRALLSEQEDLKVVGEAGDGIEAIRVVEKCAPDLLLLDLSMPRMNGISAIKEIKSRNPGTRILVLTVHKSEEYILEVFASGAEGYCLKDATQEELMSAIGQVLAGKKYVAPGIMDRVLTGYLDGRKTLAEKTPWDRLTQREKEVLKLIGEGNKNKDIAEILCISVKTVEKHRANIMDTLGLHNAAQLTAYAIEKGLVSN